MERPEQDIWMIVAEAGSDWALWAESFHGASADIVMVNQQDGELQDEFASRVRTRTQRILQDGRRLTRAVFVPGAQRASIGARSAIVRSLASSMQGTGQLILGQSRRDRHMIRALAETLHQVVRGSDISITVDVAPAKVA